MTRIGLALDPASLATLRNLAKRLGTSQSQVVRRSLRLLEQREAATPATPGDALSLLAETPSARQTTRALKARIRKQRQDRHTADEARG
ncbi:MAG: ribbon-helix-helix protein, CopG family [Vicinamibacterales bacterium]